MKTPSLFRKRGFTLIETVIAIGVLAVLLTGFVIVFAPAAAGIKKSVNLQAADRLASTLEQELVTWRPGQESATITTGFDKAFKWIKGSNAGTVNDALLAYQYRGSLTAAPRADGTPIPVASIKDQVPGKDYVVQSMVRRKGDAMSMFLLEDLPSLEGPVYLVKCTQLVFDATSGALIAGTPGQIADPKNPGGDLAVIDYPEAVIAFTAEFYALPAKSKAYFEGDVFGEAYTVAKKPIFSRNLAVRR
jgi:prepilin-type N-terminal cleavage/methylation domain-containing protein